LGYRVALPLPDCRQLHALGVELAREITNTHAASSVVFEDTTDDRRLLLIDRCDPRVLVTQIAWRDRTHHLALARQVAIGVAHPRGHHVPLHLMGGGQACIAELTDNGSIETAMDYRDRDLRQPLDHQRAELKRLRDIPERTRLVVYDHDVRRVALCAFEECLELLAACRRLAALVEVDEDLHPVARLDGRQ
jgi:hypothetical protein